MSRNGKSVVVIAAIVVLCVAVETSSRASSDSCDGAGDVAVVMLAESSSRAVMEPYAASIASQLDDLPICFSVAWRDEPLADAQRGAAVAREVAGASNTAAVFWLTPTQTGYQLRLFLPRRGDEGEIERNVEVPSKDGLGETLAVIVRVSITTAIADAFPAAPEKAASAEPTKPEGAPEGAAATEEREEEPQKNVRRDGIILLGAAYAIGITGARVSPAQGAELSIGARISKRFSLYASYRLFVPLEISKTGVDLALRRHPMQLGARFSYAFGRLELLAALGIGMDYVVEEYDLQEGNAALATDPEPRVQASIIPALGLAFELYRILYATFALSGDIVCNQYSYAARRDGEKTSIYDPWTVQPQLAVGLELRLP